MARMAYLWGMAGVRLEKFSALIKKEMSTIFQRNGNDWFPGILVTVTMVRVSPDLGYAKVYISVFPTDKREIVMEWLEENAALTRKHLGLVIGKQMRKVPELQFFIDDSLDYSEEINRLLKK